MPSLLHDGLVSLFREQPALAPDLLAQALRAELPEYTEVRIDSESLTNILPAERRADLVIQLRRGDCVFGIVVEVQLNKDQDQGFVWPVYLTTLRDRIRCPVYLLVVAPDDKVANWARQPTLLGGDSRVTPWVLRPANIPEILGPEEAKTHPALAVLSAIAHGRDDNVSKSVEIALAAQGAVATLDTERSTLYCDLVLSALSEAALRALEAMDPTKYQYQSEFARRYFGQGEAAGKIEGRAAMALRLLSLRFGTLPELTETRIRRATLSELDALAERLLRPGGLNDVLGELG
jgi:hypothetical protein